MAFVLVSCTVHMSKLQTKTTDPISIFHNHTQELWSDNQSHFVYILQSFKNLTDISSDTHFDSRNNLANSSFTGLECSCVKNGNAWPQKHFMINLVEESVLVCWLFGCHISFFLNSMKTFGHNHTLLPNIS